MAKGPQRQYTYGMICSYGQTSTGIEKLIKCESNCAIRVTGASDAARNLLSFPKIISGRICDAAQPRSELRQWHQIVGLLGARAHLSVMPSGYALDCNTPHSRKEFAAGALRRRSAFDPGNRGDAVGLVSEFSDLKRIEMKSPGARPGTGARRGFHRRDGHATKHSRYASSQLWS